MKIQIKEKITTDVYHVVADSEIRSGEHTLQKGEIIEVDNFDTDEESWGFELKDGTIIYLPIESFAIL